MQARWQQICFVLCFYILGCNNVECTDTQRGLKKQHLRINSEGLLNRQGLKSPDGESDEGKVMEAEFKKSGSPDLENINLKASLFTPGYKCRICEDVAETFRNTNKCRGIDGISKSDDGEEGTPRASEDLVPCKAPGNCGLHRDEKKKEKCKSLQTAWRKDEGTLKEIYSSVYNQDNPHKTCMKLGMCRPANEPDGAACQGVLMSSECKDDIFCDSSKCKSDDCIVCYWLIKTWPVFGDICAPGKAGKMSKAPNSAVSFYDYYGKYPRSAKSNMLEDDRDKRTPPENSALAEMCYTLWDKVLVWPRARYLITYVNQLGTTMKERSGMTGWNPNTVCKCLSLCPYNAIQGPAVDQDCVADEPVLLSRVVTESLFPDLTPQKGDPEKLLKDLVVDREDKVAAAEWWKHR